jgi:pyocin large subunit-like protein
VPAVIGFSTEYLLNRHFHDHGNDFGVISKEQYLARAKEFLEVDILQNPNILQCAKRNGDIIRFNRITNEFAVMSSIGIIKTYFNQNLVHQEFQVI